MNRRVAALRALMAREKISGYATFDPADIFYLSGFAADPGAVFASRRGAALLVPQLLSAAARAAARGFHVPDGRKDWQTPLGRLASRWRVRRAGVPRDKTTVGIMERLGKISGGGVKWVPSQDLVGELRRVKDAAELRKIRTAGRIAARAMKAISGKIRPGRTEKSIADEIDGMMRRLGAEKASFDLIVASGPNSALPHHRCGPRRFKKGDAVVVDIGCVFGGYCSDITRTFCVGRPSPSLARAYSVVAEAQRRGMDASRPGVPCGDVDRAARSVIEKAGLGRAFVHGTGHGVGVEIHERPRLAAGVREPLAAGMTVTVEPGVYLPGRFGIRIEDTILVRAGIGPEVITRP